MKRLSSSLIFIAAFLAVCLLPTLGLMYMGPSEAVANEPPIAAPSLKNWDGSFNNHVLADAADWMGQHFAFRQEAVTLWARGNAALFRTSVTDSVLLGKNGWLYYEPTRADYTGSNPMTERELWCAARTLYLLQEYARGQGADFLFAAAPNKNSLYTENMPALVRRNAPTNAQRLHKLLKEMGVNYADLFAAFARERDVLYYPTDSHWNGKGAALAADVMLSALGRTGGYYYGKFAGATHRGDLYEMLYPAGVDTDPDWRPMDLHFTADSDNADAITLRTEGQNGTGRLLCYRDSFGRNLYPYLADSFARGEFSRKNVYDPNSLAAGDVMIVELVERNLRYLLENDPVFPAPAREPEAMTWREASGESVKLTLAKGAGEGYTNLHGSFSGLMPDEDSPVVVMTGTGAGNAYYEALPRSEGFAVCLPAADAALPLRVLFTVDGQWVALAGERAES